MKECTRLFMAALFSIAFLPLMANVAVAVEYVDVDQAGGGNFVFINNWHQSFTPAANNITAVSVYLSTEGAVTIQFMDTVCGTVRSEGTATGVGWVKCDLTGAESLVPGDVYVFRAITDTGVWLKSGVNYYPGGDLYRNCDIFSPIGSDLVFKTWTDEDAVSTDSATWGNIKSMYR